MLCNPCAIIILFNFYLEKVEVKNSLRKVKHKKKNEEAKNPS